MRNEKTIGKAFDCDLAIVYRIAQSAGFANRTIHVFALMPLGWQDVAIVGVLLCAQGILEQQVASRALVIFHMAHIGTCRFHSWYFLNLMFLTDLFF